MALSSCSARLEGETVLSRAKMCVRACVYADCLLMKVLKLWSYLFNFGYNLKINILFNILFYVIIYKYNYI